MNKKSKSQILKSNRPVLTGINLLMSATYRNQYKNLAETYAQKPINFKMVKGVGSFTGFRENSTMPHMNIDLEMFENSSFSTSHYHIIAKGAIFHECGHLLYSDFEVIGNNLKYSKQLSQEVKETATKYYEADDGDKPSIELELRDKVKEYVYAANMPETLNSFEDASIERSMSEMGKDENGCISFTRKTVYDKELNAKLEGINDNLIPLDEDEWDDNTYKFVLLEARHLATMPYQNSDMTILNELFDESEVSDIQDLALYARFQSQTTADRNIVAKTFQNICHPILDKIANDLATLYIQNMEEAEQIANQMNKEAQNASNPGGTGASGLPIGQGGGSAPQLQSKYDLKLPDSVKEKMEQAAQQLVESEEEDEEEEMNSKPLPSPKELSDEAINDMNEAINNARKSFAKQENETEVNNILNHPNIRAGESSSHKNITLSIDDFDNIFSSLNEMSYEGEQANNYINNNNLISSTNEMAKKMKKILMQRSQDEISHGRREGKLDISNLYRVNTDLQVFRKDVQGQKKKIRFALLVDESGSMGNYRLTNAIIGCWMIAKAAQKLKIPFSVYGHWEENAFKVHIEKYIEYNKCMKKESLNNLFYMYSDGCNRDGLAIYHVLRELVKSAKPDEELYFIILSDGQPSGLNYRGTAAIEDMRNIMETFRKNWNVHSIGIGIGEFGFENTVGRIYENSIVVADPKQLPDEMFNVLKKILRV